MLTARDAAELATALEDALDDIPDSAPAATAPANLLEQLAGPVKVELTSLIGFLRCGPALIYASCCRRS